MDEQDEVMIERIARDLREEEFEKLPASFDARVMASIRWGDAAEPRGVSSWWEWLRRPRQLTLSPLAGLAFAASLAAFAFLGAATAVRGSRATLESSVASVLQSQLAAAGVRNSSDSGLVRSVQFVLVAPAANSVSLIGDFNDWDASATPLRKTAGNMWTADVRLEPGRYAYTFLVDGTEWVPDPAAPKSTDEFGVRNSMITVGGAL